MTDQSYDVVWPLIHLPEQRHMHVTVDMESELLELVSHGMDSKAVLARLRFCEKIRATAAQRYPELRWQPVIFEQLTISLRSNPVTPQ